MAETMNREADAMTPEQRRLVRQSFDSIRDLARPVALLFYGRLFELDASARRLFHNDLALQGSKLMDTLGAVAESLDDLEAMRPRLVELGRRHAGYGVATDQYETVTAALVWTLGQALGPTFDAPTREAWRLALGALCEVMKEGHRQG